VKERLTGRPAIKPGCGDRSRRRSARASLVDIDRLEALLIEAARARQILTYAEVAVLVVRKSDRLPGEGFFHSLWRDGAYDGPATGPVAAAFIGRKTERVFAHWAGCLASGDTRGDGRSG
jgi:hypothetical protein